MIVHSLANQSSNQVERSVPIKASNTGILGGHNYQFFSGYYQLVQNFIAENKNKINHLTPAQMVNFNTVVEQFIFHCLGNDLEIEVKYLLDTVYDPSFFESFANFHHLPNDISFMHALGDYKKTVGFVTNWQIDFARIILNSMEE